MPKPAFPQEQKPGPRIDRHDRAQFFRNSICTRWGCHHEGEARVLEGDRTRSLRNLNEEGAGNHAVRMDVPTVVPINWKMIDPQAVETKLPLQREAAFLCERRGMWLHKPCDVRESRIALGQVVQRSVAGISLVAAFPAPAPAGLIVLRESPDR